MTQISPGVLPARVVYITRVLRVFMRRTTSLRAFIASVAGRAGREVLWLAQSRSVVTRRHTMFFIALAPLVLVATPTRNLLPLLVSILMF